MEEEVAPGMMIEQHIPFVVVVVVVVVSFGLTTQQRKVVVHWECKSFFVIGLYDRYTLHWLLLFTSVIIIIVVAARANEYRIGNRCYHTTTTTYDRVYSMGWLAGWMNFQEL